jgi:hypothetical protein
MEPTSSSISSHGPNEGQIEAPITPEEFARLPVFGMWAEREEMADSVE